MANVRVPIYREAVDELTVGNHSHPHDAIELRGVVQMHPWERRVTPKIAFCLLTGRIRGHVIMIGASPAVYNASGLLSRFGTANIKYDQDGRMTVIGSHAITYGAGDRILSIGAVDIQYDQGGRAMRLGDSPMSYSPDGTLICIGRTPLDYDSWSRLIRIGFARIEYTDTPVAPRG